MPTAPHDDNLVADNVNSTRTDNLRIEFSSDRTRIWCNKRQRWVAAHGEGFEEEVRQRTLIELVTHYHYPMSLIGVERSVRIRTDEHPRRADIVIYKGENYQDPLIVIENKRPEAGPGIDQAQAYAKILGAEYAKYTDNNENRTRRLAYGLGHSPEVIEIPDIPFHGREVVYEIGSLVPFNDIKTTLTSCHKVLRDMGKDPVESFKIMSKFVIAKIFDERQTTNSEVYQMQCGRNESDAEIGQRVRALYVNALTTMTSRNDAEPLTDMELELDDHTLASLVQRIQRYSFIQTDVDSKGAVFETFIDAAFRGPFGQFFTPRTIVDFMVKLVDPKESDIIIDPACGSGGFLVYILDYVRHAFRTAYEGHLSSAEIERKVFEFAQDKIVGIDIASLPQFAAKVNMLVNNDGRANIYGRNALMPMNQLPTGISRRAGHFTIAITNPPFGELESHEEYLAQFKTALDANDSVRPNQDTKILFIERCLQLVAAGGLVRLCCRTAFSTIQAQNTFESGTLYAAKPLFRRSFG